QYVAVKSFFESNTHLRDGYSQKAAMKVCSVIVHSDELAIRTPYFPPQSVRPRPLRAGETQGQLHLYRSLPAQYARRSDTAALYPAQNSPQHEYLCCALLLRRAPEHVLAVA